MATTLLTSLAPAGPYGRCPRRHHPLPISVRFLRSTPLSSPSTIFPRSPSLRILPSLLMKTQRAVSAKQNFHGIDENMVEEYTLQAKLLKEFNNVSSIDKAWIFNANSGKSSQAMFSISQVNLLANTKRTAILSSYISKDEDHSVSFHWSSFPIEMVGVSAVVPSPSGSKLLVVRNKENGSPTQLEIWGSSVMQKEIHIPQSVHGPVYTDQWFEGISWNIEENLVAYVAEEPSPRKPVFDDSGFKKDGASDKDCGSWKGQGDWEEHWGETYSGKRRPALFVISIESGEVRPVDGVSESLSVGQVVWAPSSPESYDKYLVFVGWTSENGLHKSSRKLGMKYCYNRPCSLYAIRSPFQEASSDENQTIAKPAEDLVFAVNLTPSLSSAFFPRFCPDGTSLVFLSAKSAVDSGAHCATNSLHRMDWLVGSKLGSSSTTIFDVVPVVMCAGDGCFPGLYCSTIVSNPWLSDGSTMILCSYWGSIQVILSINVMSCKITRVTPTGYNHSWSVLALDGDNILAVSSSPIDPPQIKYGCSFRNNKLEAGSIGWNWLDVSSPLPGYSEKVNSLLSSLKFNIMKIPVSDGPGNLTEGARKPFEAIFVSHTEGQKGDALSPLIVILHGGPHTVSLASYSKSLAFLVALGYSLLIVNYRGSLGFGEEALQSLPGKVGHQDVHDVLAALDYVIEMGLVDRSKVAVLGGSHGGFLTTHLIGQAPDRFAVAAVRNPVCNLPLMVGTTDIPEWCYVETYGLEGKDYFTEAPTMEQLNDFFTKSPIAYISKVKAPILFLLGAQDLRVPVSNGMQYARALKEKGAEVKVIVFPNDAHGIERPQSDFESFLNIGVWFRKYCH